MAPEFAKKEVSTESPIEDILISQLLTSIVICLGEHFDLINRVAKRKS